MTKYGNVTVRISKMTSPMFLTLNIALCLVNDVRKPDFFSFTKIAKPKSPDFVATTHFQISQNLLMGFVVASRLSLNAIDRVFIRIKNRIHLIKISRL